MESDFLKELKQRAGVTPTIHLERLIREWELRNDLKRYVPILKEELNKR